MDEYIKRDAVHDAVSRLKRLAWQSSTTSPNAESFVAVELDAVHLVIEKTPAADVVSRDAFNHILAENDTMRAQLALIGKKPGDSMDDMRFAVYIVKEALNNYGVDVTKLWQTATAQKTALDAAYVRGKNDAYKQAAAKDGPYKPLCPNCGADMREKPAE